MNDLELLFSYKISNVYINWNIKINNYLKYYNLLRITYINLINNLTLYRYQFEWIDDINLYKKILRINI